MLFLRVKTDVNYALLLFCPPPQVENRRSVLAHAAIITMILLFAHLLKEMDKECEHTATILLYRVSEVSEFIRRVVDKVLSAMVYSCSPVCVMNALLKGGLK